MPSPKRSNASNPIGDEGGSSTSAAGCSGAPNSAMDGAVEGAPLAPDCDSSSTASSDEEGILEGRPVGSGEEGPEEEVAPPATNGRSMTEAESALTGNLVNLTLDHSLPQQQTRRPSSSSVGEFIYNPQSDY